MDKEYLGKEIVDIAFKLHKTLGPGLLESVYEVCFCHELSKRAIPFVRQKKVPVYYDGIEFMEALRLDILIVDKIITQEGSGELFIKYEKIKQEFINNLKLLSNNIRTSRNKFISFTLFDKLPSEFLLSIKEINNSLLNKQCLYLEKAIYLCNNEEFINEYDKKLEASLENRKKVFKEWETMYNLNSYV